MINQILQKYKFDLNSDRLEPDCPFTHWRLLFKSKMIKLCKKKFASFSNSLEFRYGAFAVNCSAIHIGERVVIRPGTKLFADGKDNKGYNVPRKRY